VGGIVVVVVVGDVLVDAVGVVEVVVLDEVVVLVTVPDGVVVVVVVLDGEAGWLTSPKGPLSPGAACGVVKGFDGLPG
jgi:hypothetical protein